MNGKFLLDTNIAIAFLIGDETLQRPAPSSELYISSIAIGELFYGALNSNKIDENILRLAEFIRDTVTVKCDDDTARIYGEIKTALRKKGRPIPDNDIWIAATAKQHSLSLATRDEHFEDVDQINIVRW
ncbi:MAG: type II toxin-antitoxin system VapC family toxin [Pirellulaceae bacterium]|nr:type II toxin-antitoxin system VapC family toxin [Pirellulaceae bacterium]